MKTAESETFAISLYLSGPIEAAKQILRAECLREGLCVTIEPTQFIYTGGEEAGYRVGLLNYPRFPTTLAALRERSEAILHLLLEGTHQHSGLLVAPDTSLWLTKRETA